MIRKVLSIIAGYGIFVATSLALFKISRQELHSDPTDFFVIFTTIYGVIFPLAAVLLLSSSISQLT